MTLPTSGPLALTDIQTEFGGTNPIGMNEYYAGGGLVPAATSGTYGPVPSSGALSVQNFYGTSAIIPIYIEEVFQTWLYSGNSSTQTITNGVDLSTNGGLVWLKCRNTASTFHALFDTNRGVLASRSLLSTNSVNAGLTNTAFTGFTTSGFTLGNPFSNVEINTTGQTYTSWTFRQQPKFFDVVTYTGTGVARTISHNLGSVPGCIIVKQYSATNDWKVYHRGLTSASYSMILNTFSQESFNNTVWDGTAPTSSVFSVGTDGNVNDSGASYVAYLFAHDAGGFGLTATDNVITCGSYTGNGSATGPIITLGYEPQWLMYKQASSAGNPWTIIDNMRNFGVTANNQLTANSSGQENTGFFGVKALATGFQPVSSDGSLNGSGSTYIYIAIRRGPMKVPTVGTNVFGVTLTENGSAPYASSAFPVDFGLVGYTSGGGYYTSDRLRSGLELVPNSSGAESAAASYAFNYQNGWLSGAFGANLFYTFRRAAGYFDEVCYTGTGVLGRTVTHNLTVAPELMIIKDRGNVENWAVYSAAIGNLQEIFFNRADPNTAPSNGYWNSTTPTSTVFTVGGSGVANNDSGVAYVAYLFATVAGVSKVGSYTGTGALQTINCGFTTGARFVIIKRSDDTGGWYVYDSARGLSSGNDPYFLMNSSAAQVTGTNYVDTDTTGFKVTAAAPTALNASGGTFIFLAIA